MKLNGVSGAVPHRSSPNLLLRTVPGSVARRRSLTDAGLRQAIYLYGTGLSTATIGERLGFNGTTIWLASRRASVPMRDAHGGHGDDHLSEWGLCLISPSMYRRGMGRFDHAASEGEAQARSEKARADADRAQQDQEKRARLHAQQEKLQTQRKHAHTLAEYAREASDALQRAGVRAKIFCLFDEDACDDVPLAAPLIMLVYLFLCPPFRGWYLGSAAERLSGVYLTTNGRFVIQHGRGRPVVLEKELARRNVTIDRSDSTFCFDRSTSQWRVGNKARCLGALDRPLVEDALKDAVREIVAARYRRD